MKSSISKMPGVISLGRNESLEPDCFYLIGSESVAQCLYFETLKDLKYAHSKIKEHLSGYVDIFNYLFTQHGFVLLIKTKSKSTIIDHYNSAQKRYGKLPRFQEAGQILSEKIRHALSAINAKTNALNKRSGTRVHSNFMRFIFDGLDSALKMIKKLIRGQLKLCRQGLRYQSKDTYWDEDGLLKSQGKVFLQTKSDDMKVDNLKESAELIDLEIIINEKLSNVIESTCLIHCMHMTKRKINSLLRFLPKLKIYTLRE